MSRGRKPASIPEASHLITEVPRAPAWLSNDAKAEWRRVAAIMVHRRTLTEDNLGTLENYAVAHGTVREMARVIAAEGYIVPTEKGPRKHPAVSIQSDASTRARLLANELAVTPTSRGRAAASANSAGNDSSPLGM